MGREKNMYTDVFQCIPNRPQHKKIKNSQRQEMKAIPTEKKKIEPQ